MKIKKFFLIKNNSNNYIKEEKNELGLNKSLLRPLLYNWKNRISIKREINQNKIDDIFEENINYKLKGLLINNNEITVDEIEKKHINIFKISFIINFNCFYI